VLLSSKEDELAVMLKVMGKGFCWLVSADQSRFVIGVGSAAKLALFAF
jgi:hypothetical protein